LKVLDPAGAQGTTKPTHKGLKFNGEKLNS